MKRKAMMSGQGYAAMALGVLLVGAVALVLTAGYPATSAILLLAMSVALAGIGHGWNRELKRRRRRTESRELRI
jgi:membrane protein implicated in regulation of membrane protease activity